MIHPKWYRHARTHTDTCTQFSNGGGGGFPKQWVREKERIHQAFLLLLLSWCCSPHLSLRLPVLTFFFLRSSLAASYSRLTMSGANKLCRFVADTCKCLYLHSTISARSHLPLNWNSQPSYCSLIVMRNLQESTQNDSFHAISQERKSISSNHNLTPHFSIPSEISQQWTSDLASPILISTTPG